MNVQSAMSSQCHHAQRLGSRNITIRNQRSVTGETRIPVSEGQYAPKRSRVMTTLKMASMFQMRSMSAKTE